VYSIQHYVIKFVSDLQQVSGFLQVLRFPPPIKLSHNITEILLKVALNIITLTPVIYHDQHYLKDYYNGWMNVCLHGQMFSSNLTCDPDLNTNLTVYVTDMAT
jgi:hypothetical protein